MKKVILKLKIQSWVCRVILSICVLAPIVSSGSLAVDHTGMYLGILGASLVIGYIAWNLFVHAERKLFRMRKKIAQAKNEENSQVDLAA